MSIAAEPLAADITVIALREPLSFAPDLEREVDALWRAAQRENDTLFDGEILTLGAREGSQLFGRFTRYRYLLAQLRDKQLAARLRLRPLAVAGLLRCAEGIVFGCRTVTTAQNPGIWELAPAGGIDRSHVRRDGSIDIIGKLKDELEEELGCRPSMITSATPFVLVEDRDTGVVDIGIELMSGASALDIWSAHANHDGGEYDDIGTIAPEKLADFVASKGAALDRVSRALLAARGLI